MRREVRATANRLANFDDANLRRSARAAVAAGARVKRALEILGDDIPDHLAAAGRLRLDHSQASLEELGPLADPVTVGLSRGLLYRGYKIMPQEDRSFDQFRFTGNRNGSQETGLFITGGIHSHGH